MSEYYAILHVGPVQPFIRAARRTLDHWSGSFLLSYLLATAVDFLGESNVVFPNVDGNPLFHQGKSAGWGKPWNGNPSPEAYRPSIPNRLLAVIDDTGKLAHACDRLRDAWKQIVGEVWKNLPSPLRGKTEWKAIWDRQTANPFEILYVWRQRQAGEDHKTAFQRVEALMGMRKATRWLKDPLPEPGHKCSLCGLREALRLTPLSKGGHPTRSEIRQQWAEHLRTPTCKLRYDFRDGETLCAVCTTKRLAPQYFFGYDLGIPSTSTVAAGATVKEIVDQAADDRPTGFRKDTGEFSKAVARAAKQCDKPAKSAQLPCLDGRGITADGDWFFRDTYFKARRAMLRNSVSLNGLDATRDALETLLRNVEGHAAEPSKYFAVLAADGDGMGELFSQVKDRPCHKKLSQTLAKFAVRHAPQVIERNHLGYVIYFGGDEGVAMASLQDLFALLKNLRETWEQEVVPKFQAAKLPAPGLSIGVAVAHHQEGLRGVIAAAHECVEKAKDIEGKDAFCVAILRRAGARVEARARWQFNGLKMMELLEDFRQAYETKRLSPRWIYDLWLQRNALGDPPDSLNDATGAVWAHYAREMTHLEIARLISRHAEPARGTLPEGIIARARKLNMDLYQHRLSQPGGSYNRTRFRDFMALMDLPHYVAKGGGR